VSRRKRREEVDEQYLGGGEFRCYLVLDRQALDFNRFLFLFPPFMCLLVPSSEPFSFSVSKLKIVIKFCFWLHTIPLFLVQSFFIAGEVRRNLLFPCSISGCSMSCRIGIHLI